MLPEGSCQSRCYLSCVFVKRGRISRARRGTAVVFYLATDEPGHVATVTNALLSIEELDQVVLDFFEFAPMNKIPWAERLMASAALTGRTVIKLRFPGVTPDLDKGLVKEPLGPRLFHTLNVDVDVVVVGIAGYGPDTIAHIVTLGSYVPEGTMPGLVYLGCAEIVGFSILIHCHYIRSLCDFCKKEERQPLFLIFLANSRCLHYL